MINIVDDGKEPFVVDIMDRLPRTLIEVARAHKEDPKLLYAVKDCESMFASFLERLAEQDYKQTDDNESVEHKDEPENDDEGLILFVPVGIGVIKIKDNK